jgi:NAD dependent epimerase/dehydratase family enzyme
MVIAARLIGSKLPRHTSTTTHITTAVEREQEENQEKKEYARQQQQQQKEEEELGQDQEAVVGDSILFTIMATDFSEIEIESKIFWVIKTLSTEKDSSFTLFNSW